MLNLTSSDILFIEGLEKTVPLWSTGEEVNEMVAFNVTCAGYLLFNALISNRESATEYGRIFTFAGIISNPIESGL